MPRHQKKHNQHANLDWCIPSSINSACCFGSTDTVLLDNALLPLYSTAVADLAAASSISSASPLASAAAVAAAAAAAACNPAIGTAQSGLNPNLQPLLNGAALIYQHYPCLMHPRLLAAAAATNNSSATNSSPNSSSSSISSTTSGPHLPTIPLPPLTSSYYQDPFSHPMMPLGMQSQKPSKFNRQDILANGSPSNASVTSCSPISTPCNLARYPHSNISAGQLSVAINGVSATSTPSPVKNVSHGRLSVNEESPHKLNGIPQISEKKLQVEIGTQTVDQDELETREIVSPPQVDLCESSLSPSSPDSSIMVEELFSVDENNSSLIEDSAVSVRGPKVSEVRDSDVDSSSARDHSLRSTSELFMASPSLTYNDLNNSKIWQFYVENKQNEGTYHKKIQLRNALHVMIAKYYPHAGLHIVGSSINGFGTERSDMDLCLTLSSKDMHIKKDAQYILEQLLKHIGQCSHIKEMHIIQARIPILKFRDTLTGVDCDTNMNNVVGIYNTHLMAYYSRIDWRVKPLVMFVKAWAQANDIHDASKGRLSTYCYILLVIQYLQAGCQPPLLPSLQQRFPLLFTYDRPISEIDLRPQLPWEELRSQNTSSLFELFEGFLEYYADFDFRQNAVSVRQGRALPLDMILKQMPPYEQLLTMRNFYMYVEEPFSRANVARSLFGESVYVKIRQCFRNSYLALRQQKDINILIDPKRTL